MIFHDKIKNIELTGVLHIIREDKGLERIIEESLGKYDFNNSVIAIEGSRLKYLDPVEFAIFVGINNSRKYLGKANIAKLDMKLDKKAFALDMLYLVSVTSLVGASGVYFTYKIPFASGLLTNIISIVFFYTVILFALNTIWNVTTVLNKYSTALFKFNSFTVRILKPVYWIFSEVASRMLAIPYRFGFPIPKRDIVMAYNLMLLSDMYNSVIGVVGALHFHTIKYLLTHPDVLKKMYGKIFPYLKEKGPVIYRRVI